MFGLFRRCPGHAAPPVRRARLNLESLEGRDVPSALPPAIASASIALSPSTVTLSITPSGVDKTVTVSGDLVAADTANGAVVANQTIDLGGVVNGAVVTDASGHFTKQLLASGLGTALAWADNGSSNTATAILAVAVPNIDRLLAVEEPTDWVFSGHVTGYNPGSLVITLNGLASVQQLTVTVDTNGNFTTCVHLNGTASDDGWLTANTTDIWGQNAKQALCLVYQTH